MKKIVIVTRRMIMGGIEKSLISMVEALPKDQYDITVLTMGTGGTLIDQLPPYVKIECLYGNEKSTFEKVWKSFKSKNIKVGFRIAYYTLLTKLTKTVYEQELYHSKIVPKVNDEYDLAISYHVPASFPVVYVMNNINAKQRVAWIHSDVSHYEKKLKRYKNYYEKYDKIFCVSQYSLEKFIVIFPKLKCKTDVFYNIINKQKLQIEAMNGESYIDRFNGMKLLTIGRLTHEKGHELIPGALKRLISQGYNVRWYLIGDGEYRQKILEMIKENNLEKHLVLLGEKNNPYPYIKDSNIYIQPSKHEGYCLTIAEAKLFNKPIVSTKSIGAKEQLIDGVTGLLVDYNEEDLANGVRKLINEKELRNRLINNLKECNFINTASEIDKLERVLSS